MSQQTNISAALVRTAQAINTMAGRVGTLASLTTAEKNNLVAALNEVKAIADAASSTGGAAIDDLATATDTTWSSTKIQSQITAAITAIINGAGTDSDTLKELADQITALAQADNGLLSFAAEQTLTAPQQLQGCTNLGIGDPAHDFTADVTGTLSAGL
jgi:hypothetical protein